MDARPDLFINRDRKGQVGDPAIADLAARQHGVAARRQLLAFGLTSQQIQHRLNCRRLHAVHQGVYAVGHTRLTRYGWWMAGVLACGDGALLSHRTAAALHGLLRVSGGAIHVAVPATGRAKRRGLVLHECATIGRYATVVDAIPVTTVARTLLDLGATGRANLLDIAISAAVEQGLFDLGAVEEVCATGARGTRALKRAIAIHRDTPAWSRSYFERRFFMALEDAGLPLPGVNLWIDRWEVDLVWPDHKLVVELDGPHHDFMHHRVQDAQRDAALQLLDYRVVRVHQRWFETDPAGVIATVARFLAVSP